ncbi:MAG: hypothetical protein R6V57_03030 [Vicinamibacterales bacterium]
MAIRRSAAAEIEHLLSVLCGGDAIDRETAAARLTVVGMRAVPHLIVAFDRAVSADVRVAILKVLEATPDRRGAELGAEQLESESADPAVRAAAVGLLGAYLESPESTRVLDTLTAFILDAGRPAALRLHALDVIERALPRVLNPLRARLAEDPSSAIRAWASASASTGTPVIDPRLAIEAAASGEPADPRFLRELVPAGAADAPLPTLHKLIEAARDREATASGASERGEWLAVRGVVHLALARRASRVAVYDLRESIARAAAPLPEGFAEAAALVGDAACLESIAEQLKRRPGSPDIAVRGWHDELVRAGRAIVARDRLTRRHAVMKKIARSSPDIAAALIGPGPAHRAGSASEARIKKQE